MFEDLQQSLQALHDRYRCLNEGSVAAYIPELSKADPDGYCVAITLVDGTQYIVGDQDTQFTLQSVSKPLVFGQALTTAGRNIVTALTGVEPTGGSFSAFEDLDDEGCPLNPMVNAGAIVTASLIPGNTHEDRTKVINDMVAKYTGAQPTLDQAVMDSELRTGDRNRALGYLLKDKGYIEGSVTDALNLYFHQCSLKVNTQQLANAAATLANHGVNPVTQQRAVSTTYVKDILVVMLMSGMYNYAGRWAYEIGIPAKSGVSGAIFGVIPGVMGIGVYSPRLDEYSNSTRGIETFRDLTKQYNLHFLGPDLQTTDHIIDPNT
ncbi:MAG: glutaminase A [Phycisphaerales bacterium]|nr:glutaminase A [Phycisphaerales bacterium]